MSHRVLLKATDGVDVTTVIDAVPAEDVLRRMGAATSEISTNAFLRRLMEDCDLTFEAARDQLYRLLESGRVELTSRYKLRIR